MDLMCVQTRCMSELVEAGAPEITAASALSNCQSAMCNASCAGDARADVATNDARPNDAPIGN
jgi:hypothetical protein